MKNDELARAKKMADAALPVLNQVPERTDLETALRMADIAEARALRLTVEDGFDRLIDFLSRNNR